MTEQSNKKRGNDALFYLLLLAAGLIAAYAGYLYFSQPDGIVITWTTENQIDVLGYNIYRSDTADGAYEQVNDQLIPASEDALSEEAYQFQDEAVESGETYFYKLETIDLNGSSELADPIELVAR